MSACWFISWAQGNLKLSYHRSFRRLRLRCIKGNAHFLLQRSCKLHNTFVCLDKGIPAYKPTVISRKCAVGLQSWWEPLSSCRGLLLYPPFKPFSTLLPQKLPTDLKNLFMTSIRFLRCDKYYTLLTVCRDDTIIQSLLRNLYNLSLDFYNVTNSTNSWQGA